MEILFFGTLVLVLVKYWPLVVLVIGLLLWISISEKCKQERENAERIEQELLMRKRTREEKEKHRSLEAQQRKFDKEQKAVERMLESIYGKLDRPSSLSDLLKALENSRNQLQHINVGVLRGYGLTLYEMIYTKTKCADAELINAYISQRFDEICVQALKYKSVEDFEKELRAFFAGIDRLSGELPVESLRHVEEIKVEVGFK